MKGRQQEDPEGQALQDLMAAMGSMRQNRVKGLGAPTAPPAAPAAAAMQPPFTMPAAPPPDGSGQDMSGELPAGMDPRLAEIIRKKKSGAAY